MYILFWEFFDLQVSLCAKTNPLKKNTQTFTLDYVLCDVNLPQTILLTNINLYRKIHSLMCNIPEYSKNYIIE